MTASASFVRAGGWWDILSDAPFFFAAGFAIAPPGPPPMYARTAPVPTDSAPYVFAWRSQAPGSVIPTRPLAPPAVGVQWAADMAPFTYVQQPALALKFIPVRPPAGALIAIAAIWDASPAPFSWLNQRVPVFVLPPPPPAPPIIYGGYPRWGKDGGGVTPVNAPAPIAQTESYAQRQRNYIVQAQNDKSLANETSIGELDQHFPDEDLPKGNSNTGAPP